MEADLNFVVKLISSLVFCVLLSLFVYGYTVFVVKPQELRAVLKKQGIRGPSPSFLVGNIPQIRRIKQQLHHQHHHHHLPETTTDQNNDDSLAAIITHNHWLSTVFPHLLHWIDEYGPTFMYSSGDVHQLCTTDIELVKEICLSTSLHLGKPAYLSTDYGPILGNSIFATNGPIWAHHRKIIAPEFYIDKVKSLGSLMVDSTASMLRSWESRIESGGGVADMDVDPDLRSLSADIISRSCFGSNYTQGKEIFSKLKILQNLLSTGYIGIPGLRYLPTKDNREIWRLEEEINSMIVRIVKQRAEADYERDLLQMILEGARADREGDPSQLSLDKFIVGNCKAIYFAGHETTAITAAWSLMLLAANPEWQTRARNEVLEICKDNLPDADMLQNMKTITMVIQETLRLYPPASFAIRTILQDVRFKDMIIPKGMNIQIPTAILQQDANLWGAEAHKFNPDRFANGILGASTSPHAYKPFGMGARVCVGQHFAMVELKVILSLVLSKFHFSLSPSYLHSPTLRMVVQPEHGVSLRIRRL